MAVVPLWDDSYNLCPTRILNQHFGLALDEKDLNQPFTTVTRCPAGYLRNWKPPTQGEEVGSVVLFDKDKFEAILDVKHFKPEDISVKVNGHNTVIIEGKHEEKEDKYGRIYRHFVRRYVLPRNCDISKVESKLSSDGVLAITAPRTETEVKGTDIPIVQTEELAKATKCKKDDKKGMNEKGIQKHTEDE